MEYGSFKKHFISLCTECDESIRSIGQVLKNI
jgi:hypothetical protein